MGIGCGTTYKIALLCHCWLINHWWTPTSIAPQSRSLTIKVALDRQLSCLDIPIRGPEDIYWTGQYTFKSSILCMKKPDCAKRKLRRLQPGVPHCSNHFCEAVLLSYTETRSVGDEKWAMKLPLSLLIRSSTQQMDRERWEVRNKKDPRH